MLQRCRTGRWIATGLCLFGLAAASPVAAEDVEKKFRIGVTLGGWNADDEVSSDAANVLTLVDRDLQLADRFIDPRDDSSVFGNLDINSGQIATISGQYALTKIFLVEASVGYHRSDVGDVEAQVQYSGLDVPELDRFDFSTHRIPVGEMERVPIQITALARFRPRASFNPYFGLGVGYAIIGFEPSAAFNDLSRNMDASRGGQATLTSALFGNPELVPPTAARIVDLEGASIEARDTFEWHLAAGAELSIKRKWAVVLDLRYTKASRKFSVGFNGGDYLGIPVPQIADFDDSEFATMTYGAIEIREGGLFDGGSLVPRPGQPAGTDCTLTPGNCTFDVNAPDGELDPGLYYVQGGKFDFNGFAMQIGFRRTF